MFNDQQIAHYKMFLSPINLNFQKVSACIGSGVPSKKYSKKVDQEFGLTWFFSRNDFPKELKFLH